VEDLQANLDAGGIEHLPLAARRSTSPRTRRPPAFARERRTGLAPRAGYLRRKVDALNAPSPRSKEVAILAGLLASVGHRGDGDDGGQPRSANELKQRHGAGGDRFNHGDGVSFHLNWRSIRLVVGQGERDRFPCIPAVLRQVAASSAGPTKKLPGYCKAGASGANFRQATCFREGCRNDYRQMDLGLYLASHLHSLVPFLGQPHRRGLGCHFSLRSENHYRHFCWHFLRPYRYCWYLDP
jgi:hypothetical protein